MKMLIVGSQLKINYPRRMLSLLWGLAFSISSIICHGATVTSDAYRVTGLKKFGAEGQQI